MEVFDNDKGEGLNAISILGSIFTGIFCLPALPVCLIQLVGGLDFMKQKNEKENKKSKKLITIYLKIIWLRRLEPNCMTKNDK